MNYLVHFEYFDRKLTRVVDSYSYGIQELSKGIWLDGNLELTRLRSKQAYWIPPARLIAIEIEV